MGRLLFLLFTVVPLAELYLLLWLGDALGVWPTVAIVVVTAVLGASLAKWQGLRALRGIQSGIAQGTPPDRVLLAGLLVLIGGVLLVTPGVITDVLGLSLLIPWTRGFAERRLRLWFEKKLASGQATHTFFVVNTPQQTPFRAQVIDVESRTVSSDKRLR